MSPELNGLQILIVVGKLIAVMSMMAFVCFTCLAQYWFWTHNEKKDYDHMTKKFKMVYMFGKWEFRGLMAYALLFVAFALVSAIWHAAIKGF